MNDTGDGAMDAATRERIETFVEELVAEYDLGSLACGIYTGGEEHTIVVGEADLESSTPATSDTRYCIGSCTKSVAAVGLLRLVEQGKVNLAASPTTYIDGLPDPFEEITLEQLLSHSSGLPSDSSAEVTIEEAFDIEDYPYDVTSIEGFKEFLHEVTVTSKYSPGERKLYYNSGYSLLGQIISTVTETSFEDYTLHEVLAPPGITDAAFNKAADDEDIATGYLRTDDGLVRKPYPEGPVFNPAGGLFLNAADAARYMSFMVDGRFDSEVLGDKAATELTTPRIEAEPGASITGDSSYCLGMYQTEFLGNPTYCHGGIVNNSSAGFAFDEHDGVMIMFNSQNPFYPSNIPFAILALLKGHDVDAVPYFELKEKLERLEGTYTDEAGVLELEVEAAHPFLEATLDSEVEPFTARFEPDSHDQDNTTFWTRRENGQRAAEPIEFAEEDGTMTFYWLGHRFQRTNL